MKSYLCLLLIALIACESTNKDNEIVLKASDFINDLFEAISTAFSKCGWDSECLNNELYDVYNDITDEDYLEFAEFLSSSECYDFCYDKLSAKNSEDLSQMYCSGICSAY